MSRSIIRLADTDDLADLVSLRGAYAAEHKGIQPSSDDSFSDRFAAWFRDSREMSRWWVAEADGRLFGLVHLFFHHRMPMPTYDPGGWAYVSLLYVRPDERGNGVGGRLLDVAREEAKCLGMTTLLLHPTEKAMGLYRRCGYRQADDYMVRAVDGTG